jgi:hypothetical protein
MISVIEVDKRQESVNGHIDMHSSTLYIFSVHNLDMTVRVTRFLMLCEGPLGVQWGKQLFRSLMDYCQITV